MSSLRSPWGYSDLREYHRDRFFEQQREREELRQAARSGRMTLDRQVAAPAPAYVEPEAVDGEEIFAALLRKPSRIEMSVSQSKPAPEPEPEASLACYICGKVHGGGW